MCKLSKTWLHTMYVLDCVLICRKVCFSPNSALYHYNEQFCHPVDEPGEYTYVCHIITLVEVKVWCMRIVINEIISNTHNLWLLYFHKILRWNPYCIEYLETIAHSTLVNGFMYTNSYIVIHANIDLRSDHLHIWATVSLSYMQYKPEILEVF